MINIYLFLNIESNQMKNLSYQIQLNRLQYYPCG